MPSPYSLDLRLRVLAAAEAKAQSREEIAHLFQIAVSTIYSWVKRSKAGKLAPDPHGGGPERSIDEAGEQILRALHAEQNDRTLEEYASAYQDRTGVQVSISTLCRTLQRLDLPRKKRR